MNHSDHRHGLLGRIHGPGTFSLTRLVVCIAALEVSQLVYLAAVSGTREDAQALIARGVPSEQTCPVEETSALPLTGSALA